MNNKTLAKLPPPPQTALLTVPRSLNVRKVRIQPPYQEAVKLV